MQQDQSFRRASARQIGKSYSVNELGKRKYKNKTLYINFLNKDDYFKYLKDLANPIEIINIIKIISKKPIDET